ncbi:MAG: ATP-binding protein [Alsobacter sp.]
MTSVTAETSQALGHGILRGGIFDAQALPGTTGIALVVFGALLLLAVLVALVLLRRQLLLEAKLDEAEAVAERLHDQIWELRESEERYRSLLEGQDDLIQRRDARGRLTYVNEAYAALAGRAAETLLGTSFELTRDPASLDAPRTAGSSSYDEAIVTPYGVRWISWHDTAIAGPYGTEIQSVGRDVTERMIAERALAETRMRAVAASEAKSRFLATMSHEIRTPLNGVLGMADLLAGTEITPEQRTYVEAVKTSGEALLSIIDEILDFSKIEAGKLELVHERFDLLALVEGTVELLAPRAQGKGIAVAAYVAPDVPRHVLGDAARLRQVLTNLVGNAVKFTEAGGVGLAVQREGERIAFSVSDTGMGIPEDRLASIFDEFEQADGSASRRHSGTGLGLAISKRLVSIMGGELTVSSRLGEGSSFRFCVDLPTLAEQDPGRPGFSALQGKSVLFVSMTAFESSFIAQRLGEAGASVTRAADAPSALAKLGEGPRPDVVMVDGGVGEASAREIASRSRALGVQRRLVLLSPFERRSFGAPGALGFDAYLMKPVREASLAERVAAEDAVASRPRGLGAPKPATPAAPGLNILLAEDNEINALLATRLLERNGARITWARDGLEAVELFRASLEGEVQRFDVILMDVRMPGLDGHEAVRRIRAMEREQAAPRSRIVALTANAFDEDRRLALSAGMDETVSKPIDEASLIVALGGPLVHARLA